MEENLLNLEQQVDPLESLPHPDSGMMPDEPVMMVVHLKPEEIIACNEMQGGESIDPELEIPEFRRLGKLFDIPEFRGMFIKHMTAIRDFGHEDPEIKYLDHALPHPDMPDEQFHRPPADALPEVQMIEHDGHNGDNTIGYFPENVLDVFDEVMGGPSTNEDGLPQYGKNNWFSRALGSFGREALRTVGFAMGPITNYAARRVTGSSHKDSLNSSLKSLAFNAVAVPLMLSAPAALSAAGTAFGGSAGTTGATAGTTAAGTAGGTGAALGAQPAASSIGSSILSSLNGPLGGMLGSAALMAYGHGKDQKAIKKAREDDRREKEEHWKKMGMDTPLYDMNLPPLRMRTEPFDAHKLKHGIDQPLFYKKGGHVAPHIYKSMDPDSFVHIKGPGKGQDDVIDTDDVKHGDFIIDATTTAHTGDGSSEAGAAEWKRFMDKMTHKYMAEGGKIDDSPRPIVPASLSNDELKIPHMQVTAIGGGSNPLGAKILSGMQHVIRDHKSSRGPKLPPPAKPLEKYMKESMRLKGVA